MRKVVYIIPGFTHSPKSKDYKKIVSNFQSKGFVVFPVSIEWKYKVMTDYVNEFIEFFHETHKKGNEVYLFGFSFGAIVAFVASTKIKPKMQVLCSLSPYFKEDLPFLKESWNKGFKRRLEDIRKNYSFDKLVKSVGCKSILIAGDKEFIKYPQVKKKSV